MATVLPQITRIGRVALDLFFPRWCIGCRREGDNICPACRAQLPVITPPVCPRCGRPEPEGSICRDCRNEPSHIDGIRAPFFFDGIVRQAVHEMKYRNLRALAPMMAELLADYLIVNPIPADVLVPVPLHRKRLRERGYNQSALLAGELGKLIGLPVATDGLVRHHYASPQARSAGVNERKQNVTGAFICDGKGFEGKKVLLIDDVSTSGATLSACAGILKSAGAAAVWGLVMALEL